jgi:5S rRNA maturation endonuclease (ribonuclease M5)
MITSSLKDLMSFVKLSIGNIECIAPDSENTMITSAVLKDLKAKYTKIILLFDNDDPGINAAKKYKDLYDFNYVVLPLEKDLSDSVKIHGIDKVREVLFSLLKQAL